MNRIGIGIVLLGMLVGCGGSADAPELGTVTGNMTFDNEPLPNATLTFSPVESGRPSSAVTDDDGDYELLYTFDNAGAPPGKYQVSITSATTTTDDAGNDVDVPERLPAKYNSQTELEEEVKPGPNTIDFKLDSDGVVDEGEDDDDDGDSSAPVC